MTLLRFLASWLIIAAAAPALAAGEGVMTAPKDLSLLAMVLQADWIVKSVMLGLALCSLATWSVFFAKKLALGRSSQQLRALSLHMAGEAGQAPLRQLQEALPDPARGMAAAALEEMAVNRAADPSAVKERIQARLALIEQAHARAGMAGLGLLATIGSVSPFVGLFGTVWGIMNSFIGISKAQTTNLAVVAPGIAEALLATAIGLVAAIPAVVLYNHFVRVLQARKAMTAQISGRILILAARELDRAHALKLAA